MYVMIHGDRSIILYEHNILTSETRATARWRDWIFEDENDAALHGLLVKELESHFVISKTIKRPSQEEVSPSRVIAI
jgi:hypothetical protein